MENNLTFKNVMYIPPQKFKKIMNQFIMLRKSYNQYLAKEPNYVNKALNGLSSYE